MYIVWACDLQDDYRIVCETGCQPIGAYEADQCNFGEAPARSLVGRPGWHLTEQGMAAITALTSNNGKGPRVGASLGEQSFIDAGKLHVSHGMLGRLGKDKSQ